LADQVLFDKLKVLHRPAHEGLRAVRVESVKQQEQFND